jgi:hypothetical protein
VRRAWMAALFLNRLADGVYFPHHVGVSAAHLWRYVPVALTLGRIGGGTSY